MVNPTIELDAQDEGSSSPTYDIAVIDGGSPVANKVLRFCGAGSSDGDLKNITVPGSGNIWAPQFWLEDTVGADANLNKVDPDQATQGYMMFKLFASAGGTSFATKPRITAYDDNSHPANNTDEVFDGTTNHTSPFIKARGQTLQDQPPQWWGEASSAALHTLDGSGGGAVACGNATGNEENCALDGDLDYLEASVTNIETTPQYFSVDLSVPDDATLGVNSMDVVLTIRYTYT